MIKQNMTKWTGYIAAIGTIANVHRITAGKVKGNLHLET
jgi:hypothetical protein